MIQPELLQSGEESLLLQQYTFTPASKCWAVNFPAKFAVPFFPILYQISLFDKSRNKGSFKTQVGMKHLFQSVTAYSSRAQQETPLGITSGFTNISFTECLWFLHDKPVLQPAHCLYELFWGPLED